MEWTSVACRPPEATASLPEDSAARGPRENKGRRGETGTGDPGSVEGPGNVSHVAWPAVVQSRRGRHRAAPGGL